jgi:hypothetical protein
VAPFNGGNVATQFGQASQAVQVVEAVLSRAPTVGDTRCGGRSGQAGGAPEGGNFSACTGVDALGVAQGIGQPQNPPTDTGVK